MFIKLRSFCTNFEFEVKSRVLIKEIDLNEQKYLKIEGMMADCGKVVLQRVQLQGLR